KRLTVADSAWSTHPPGADEAIFLKPDWVVFVRGTALVARKLDLPHQELIGDPVTIADPIGIDPKFSAFSASDDGRLAYRSTTVPPRRMAWFDRSGKSQGEAVGLDANDLLSPALSRDGRHLAVSRSLQNNVDIWKEDLARGGLQRLTFDPYV